MKYNGGARTEIISRMSGLAPGRVLDIGCNSGATLHALPPTWGAHAHVGIDVEQESISSAPNITLLKRDIFDVQPDSFGKFDYVMALDVIEHVYDTSGFLAKCRQLLAPNGKLIISVPNIRFLPALATILFKKDFPEQEAGIFDRTHIRHFTRLKICRSIRAAGFNINHCEGINSLAEVQPNPWRLNLMRIVSAPLSIIDGELLFQQYYLVCSEA